MKEEKNEKEGGVGKTGGGKRGQSSSRAKSGDDLTQRPWRDSAYWFSSHILPRLLSYRT